MEWTNPYKDIRLDWFDQMGKGWVAHTEKGIPFEINEMPDDPTATELMYRQQARGAMLLQNAATQQQKQSFEDIHNIELDPKPDPKERVKLPPELWEKVGWRAIFLAVWSFLGRVRSAWRNLK